MKRCLAHLLSFSVLLLSLVPARGDWSARRFDEPVFEVFDAKTFGRGIVPYSFAQHPQSGLMVVGEAERLLTFDGLNWREYEGAPDVRNYTALAFSADGKILWTGTANDIGYFETDATGQYRYHSLRSHVPEMHLPLQIVWSCHARENGADFVAQQKVLRWDGTKIQAWEFPTSQRLFPVTVDGELWFTHRESGLYRMGPDGPEKMAGTHELPSRAAISITRQQGELVGYSPLGIVTIGEQPKTLSSPALNAVLAERAVTGTASLPGGFTAIGTIGGLLVIDAHGQLVREVRGLGNLTGATITALFLDRENWLWVASSKEIVRLDTTLGASRIALRPGATQPAVRSIQSDSARLWFVTDREIGTLRPPDQGSVSYVADYFTPQSRPPHDILPWNGTALITRYASIDAFDGRGLNPLFTLNARTFYGLARARPDSDLLLTRESYFVGLLRQEANHSWNIRSFKRPTPFPTSILMDSVGAIWVGESKQPATRYEIEGDNLRDVTPVELKTTTEFSPSHVLWVREAIWILQRGNTWRAHPGGRLERLPFASPLPVLLAQVSPTQRRIYVALDRSRQGTGVPTALGIIELDEKGNFQSWREPWIPALHTLGGILSMHATLDDEGRDRLWLGGSNGLFQVRPEQLADWKTPPPPLLSAATEPTNTTALPFSGHAISFRLMSPEIARRPELRFETRLNRGNGTAWQPASAQDRFDFSNLTDGDYRFEARAVAPTGATSEPVAFSFVVRPPWFRTGWAYAAYFSVGLAGLFGALHYRERRVRARNQELERLVTVRTAELEKANAAKDEFLASMSHEIRNPMNGVVGLSAAIDTAPLDAEGKHRFDLLRHCAAHLATLLEDILDFSRLQSGRIELHETAFAPAELLESVVAITSSDSSAAGVPVKTALAPQTPEHLVGDARRLRQVLLNFVSNALKYAGRGEVDVTVWTRPAEGGRVEITFAVSDEGPGIPLEEQQRVFLKFERGSAARDARIPGTGMGLAVCRTLAEQMGGRVWLESEPGQGSTFYLAVPLALAPEPDATAAPLAAVIERVRKLALVVDDEEYNCIAHAALLERHGFEVRTVRNGQAALFAAAEERFDVIFLDYDMPDVKGPELARRLRLQHSTNGHQPFLIAATAYTTVEKRAECLAAGMDAFLGKPVAAERLREVIAEAVQTRLPPDAHHVATGRVEEPPDNDGYIADRLDNLRLLAAHKGRTVDAELEHYRREFAGEFDAIHEGLARRDVTAAARSAHQLAGRFGFVHERQPALLALELEQLCRSHRWDEAAALEQQLAEAWERLQADLKRYPTGPTA